MNNLKKIYFLFLNLIGSNIFADFTTELKDFTPVYEKPFVIVITSFNNKNWYKKNLDSVFIQKYNNYRVIYLDDASKDGTGNLVKEYIAEKKQTEKTNLIINPTWQSQMANHYKAVQLCKDNEIVVHLDGDDWLANENVLTLLNKVYQKFDIWLTYGNLLWFPRNVIGYASMVPDEIIKENKFREYKWMYSHLRSFYAILFKQIKVEDLKYKGSFAAMSPSPDSAFMYPMLEMAGVHIKFIPDILYIYNTKNPISQAILNERAQISLNSEICKWPKYLPKADLF